MIDVAGVRQLIAYQRDLADTLAALCDEVERLRAAQPVPVVRVVHVLKYGVALCGAGTPIQWPADDRWIADRDPDAVDEATCVPCRAAANL